MTRMRHAKPEPVVLDLRYPEALGPFGPGRQPRSGGLVCWQPRSGERRSTRNSAILAAHGRFSLELARAVICQSSLR